MKPQRRERGDRGGARGPALETELGGVEVYRMAISCAVNEDLKSEWEKYLSETENHVQIVEQVFEIIGKPARGKTCEAIIGIIEEGKSIMEEFKGTEALDAGLIADAFVVASPQADPHWPPRPEREIHGHRNVPAGPVAEPAPGGTS